MSKDDLLFLNEQQQQENYLYDLITSRTHTIIVFIHIQLVYFKFILILVMTFFTYFDIQ